MSKRIGSPSIARLDARYLKLLADNDPLLNTLTITPATDVTALILNNALSVVGVSDKVQATFKANATQTANIVENQLSDATVVSGFDERGILFSDGGIDSQSVYIGSNAGKVGATGSDNTGVGYLVLTAVTSGNHNTAFGSLSLRRVIDGTYNVGIGTGAGQRITSGVRNMAIGALTLDQITTTDANVAIGYNAFRFGTALANSIAIGQAAGFRLSASASVFIGKDAGGFNHGDVTQTGVDDNTGIGTLALYSIETNSIKNSSIGNKSGYSLTSGSSNIFLGNESGYRQTTLSNLLIVDNQTRADIATELTNSILYGVMAATPAAQTLRLNAAVTATEALTIGKGAAGVDYVFTFDGETNDGTITYMEDEDRFDFSAPIKVPTYERHIQIPALLTGNAANTPTPVDNFTVGGLQFAQTVEKFAFVQWEIPDDWDGTDIYFEVDWYPDATALADPDVVEWTIEYRAIAVGEAINNGTSVTLSPAYDAGVSGALAQYITEHTMGTLTFNNANQPLTAQDHVYFKVSRNVAATNDFNSTVVVPAFEIIYNSTTIPTN